MISSIKICLVLIFTSSLSYCHNLSTHIAIPIPPPIHKAATPRLAPVRFKPYNRVTRILQPDAPIGCPRARAPPLTFTYEKVV